MTGSQGNNYGSSAREPKPLRIALVSTEAGWYGGERQAYLLAKILREKGHSCTGIVRKGGQLAQRLERAGVPIVTFKGRGRDPMSLMTIRRELKRLDPDIIQFNDGQAMNSGPLASLGLSAVKIAARRVDFPIRSVSRYRRGVDLVFCVSEAIREVCIESGIPGSMLRVVAEGVDPTRMESGDRSKGRASLYIGEDVPLLLSVARISLHKGHEFLVKAMKKVAARRPDAMLALAGEGDLFESVKEQVSDLGLTEQIRFLGYRSDVPDLMKAADLFILPSIMEGLGTSVIDAMFAGIPIVTTEAGGIPELVRQREGEEGPCAWIVPPADPDSLSDAILEAMENEEERDRRSARALERANREFTAEAMAERTLAAYREALADRG
ncbi:MAG: glycosyltransferase family 4 protein [Acidobacteriota bacterium]|nr:MAG: glycosyltransferase family 4 protein [Acidobacteriota bacterium]